ncbi:MAG: hypothetical protein Q8936_09770, partial [Bacillota bacterium]|nr:hypothetical protein [Bacillota bacterium]
MMPTMMELSLFTSNTSFIMSFNKKVIKGDKHTRANFLGDVLGYIAEYCAFEGVGRIGSAFKIPKVGNTMSKIWGSSKFESMARMPKIVTEQYAKNLIPGMVPADVGGSLKGGFDFSGFMKGSLSEIKDTLKSAWSQNNGESKTNKVVWKNGWRTSDGKFGSPAGPGKSGALAEQEVWDAIKQKDGWDVIEGHISVRDATGQLRVYDGAAISPSGKVIGLEVKSGSATKTTGQRAFDELLNSSPYNKAYGVGKSNGIVIDRSIEIRR